MTTPNQLSLLSKMTLLFRGQFNAFQEGPGLYPAHRTALLEIDLLRPGKRVPMQKPLPSVPYFVFLTRNENKPFSDIWPILLQDPLPRVPVPLLPGDQDVFLNLQQAFTTVYDLLSYDLSIDYTKPPKIPLPSDIGAWAEELLNKHRNGN